MNKSLDNAKVESFSAQSDIRAQTVADDLKNSPEVEKTIAEIRNHMRAEHSTSHSGLPPEEANYQFDGALSFGIGGRGVQFLGLGWHLPEPLFSWTSDLHAFLYFNLPPTEDDLVLEFKATGYINGRIHHQDVLLEANGILCCRLAIAREYGYSIIIPKSVVESSRELVIRFTCLTRSSPSQFKRGADRRMLGMALHSLVIHESFLLPSTAPDYSQVDS